MTVPLLEVRNLNVHFSMKKKLLQSVSNSVKAVNDIQFTVQRGQTLGIVGESGCGKSTLARTIMGLQTPTSGEILFEGKNISSLTGNELRRLRQDIQMVYQDPFTSLNPRMSAGEIIAAPLKAFKKTENLTERVEELLTLVGLQATDAQKFPHEFSGGQRQRIGIARALALNPKLLILDEPVSALDVSVQAQVINLLEKLQAELGLTYVFIAHDLSIVKHISDKVAVMYLGEILELSPSEKLYNTPKHPYTKALLSAIPLPDPIKERQRKRIVLTGELPSPTNPPKGCKFHTRCPFAQDKCKVDLPRATEWQKLNRQAACFYPIDEGEIIQ